MRRRQEEQFELKVAEVKHETANAVLIVTLDGDEAWLPFSQIHELHKDDSPPRVVMTAWIAKKKGFY